MQTAINQTPISFKTRFAQVQERINRAAMRVGRSADEVTLIAVSKTHAVDTISEAMNAGARDFGENKIQEAENKIEVFGRGRMRWHLIGHLQSNKARKAVRLFDFVHTVDSVELVERLERICAEEDRRELNVFAQVDLANEQTKAGVSADELKNLIESFDACERVRLMGLMILPPFFENAEDVRPYFRRLRELSEMYAGAFPEGKGELSMGMSHDYEIAVEEGATFVRVGTQLFGARGK